MFGFKSMAIVDSDLVTEVKKAFYQPSVQP